MRSSRLNQRRGAVSVLAALALIALLGMAALAIDVGLLCVAAQIAQNVADASALGAGAELPTYGAAREVALAVVAANSEAQQGLCALCNSDGVDDEDGDIRFWGPYETVPDLGPLGGYAWCVEVSAHVPVQYGFARVFGLTEATVSRSCKVARMPVGGIPISPMWISYTTEYQYGQEQQLLMADGPHYAGIPGSFGWLEPPSGQSSEFLDLLRGYDLTREQIVSNYTSIGEIETAYTGESVGQWRSALDKSSDGLARMERGMDEPWTYDTFDDFYRDNPRLMIIPMVEYLGGSGNNAQFEIKAFGAFWLESVNSSKKPYSINGRFVTYTIPGADGDPLSPETGLWTVRMVQ